MTDILAERFAAIADTTDTGDWLDVRRRARPRRRLIAAVAAAAAVIAVATAAVAVGNGWIFHGRTGGVTATRTITFRGTTYRLVVDSIGKTLYCTRLARLHGPALASACGLPVLGAPSPDTIPLKTVWVSSGHLRVGAAGDQIWFGAAWRNVIRVVVTGLSGRTFATTTTAAPASLGTTLRFWAIAVPEQARSLTAYNAHGHAVVVQSTILPPVPVPIRP